MYICTYVYDILLISTPQCSTPPPNPMCSTPLPDPPTCGVGGVWWSITRTSCRSTPIRFFFPHRHHVCKHREKLNGRYHMREWRDRVIKKLPDWPRRAGGKWNSHKANQIQPWMYTCNSASWKIFLAGGAQASQPRSELWAPQSVDGLETRVPYLWLGKHYRRSWVSSSSILNTELWCSSATHQRSWYQFSWKQFE